MLSDIAKFKKTSADLKLLEQGAMLLKKLDQIGRQSPTITREDILGKKRPLTQN